ncbi:hypothetical protein CKO22_01110 [Thiococcus pfennigii]|nr:hypothetical protein [Thiococcus pfennigii]
MSWGALAGIMSKAALQPDAVRRSPPGLLRLVERTRRPVAKSPTSVHHSLAVVSVLYVTIFPPNRWHPSSKTGESVDRLRKFMLLDGKDKRLYLSVILSLLATKAALRFVSPKRLRAWLVPGARGADRIDTTADPGELERLTLAIERSGRLLARAGIHCLPQALVGYQLLRRKGFGVELKIGVRKDAHDRLVAHAWLVHEGDVVLGGLDKLPLFTPFPWPEGLPR